MKNLKNIKSKPLIFLLVTLIIISIGGTIAYYYNTVTLPNQFKTMTYDVDLTEEFYDDFGTKKVYITNNESSNTPVVLRISYNEIWSKQIGDDVVTISNTYNGINIVNKTWTNTFLNNFMDGNDGWFYYDSILSPNDTIQILESISLNSSIIENTPYYNDYLDFDYNLIINYEALAADESTVSEIWNKNITITGTSVSWT